MKPRKPKPDITDRVILELWEFNEQSMGEQAALHVSCEQLGITFDEAMDILYRGSPKQSARKGRK